MRLSDYPKPIRQLVVRGLGRDTPTVIITSHFDATPKYLLERYARRMTIEQRLAEAIRSFHLDALSSAVPLNIDLDVVLSVLAGAICSALGRRLPGYQTATPDTLQRRFLQTGGTILKTNDTITVRLDRRAFIYAQHLRDHGRPPGSAGRIALPVAGDDQAAKSTVMALVEELGFDAVDAGGLAESWRQQPGTPVYATDLDANSVRRALAEASPERAPEFRATPNSPGTYTNPA